MNLNPGPSPKWRRGKQPVGTFFYNDDKRGRTNRPPIGGLQGVKEQTSK